MAQHKKGAKEGRMGMRRGWVTHKRGKQTNEKRGDGQKRGREATHMWGGRWRGGGWRRVVNCGRRGIIIRRC